MIEPKLQSTSSSEQEKENVSKSSELEEMEEPLKRPRFKILLNHDQSYTNMTVYCPKCEGYVAGIRVRRDQSFSYYHAPRTAGWSGGVGVLYCTCNKCGIADSISLPLIPRDMQRKEMLPEDAIRRWPRITAHMIAESLGYATPISAASIVLNGANNHGDYCEWIYSCYKTIARNALIDCIKRRKHHKGYMAEYRQAKALVANHIKHNGQHDPTFASWF